MAARRAAAAMEDHLLAGAFLDGLAEPGRGGGDRGFEAAYLRHQRAARVRAALGGPRARAVRQLIGNLYVNRQSVVKRIARGGCRDARALRRQLDYVTRAGAVAAWGNVAGLGADALSATDLPAIVASWTAGWRGAPQNGHSEHLLLSFPKDTDPALARRIAEDWGERLFGSGDFGDSWRYVAAFHTDRDHPHAHFIIDRRGMDAGTWLSLGRFGPFDYQMMRELQAEIAAEHRLEIHASSRLSRGLAVPPVADREVRSRQCQGRVLDPDPTDGLGAHGGPAYGQDAVEAPTGARRSGPVASLARDRFRAANLALIAESYRDLATAVIAAARDSDDPTDAPMLDDLGQRLTAAATRMEEGSPVDIAEPASPQAALEWIEAQAGALREELQGAFRIIAELPESPEKAALQDRFTATAREVQGALHDSAELQPYLTPATHDPYAVPELAAMQAMTRFTAAPELVQAMERQLGTIRDRLTAHLQVEGIVIDSTVAHLLQGRSLSAGQLGDWWRTDVGGWLTAQGESLETARPAMALAASRWLVERIGQAQALIEGEPSLIPTEVYGWMAFQHDPDGHEGRSLAEISPRYAERLTGLSEDDLDLLARGEPGLLGEEIRLGDSRQAFAADALAQNRDRLVALGHHPEVIDADATALRSRAGHGGEVGPGSEAGAGSSDPLRDPVEERARDALRTAPRPPDRDEDDYSL